MSRAEMVHTLTPDAIRQVLGYPRVKNFRQLLSEVSA